MSYHNGTSWVDISPPATTVSYAMRIRIGIDGTFPTAVVKNISFLTVLFRTPSYTTPYDDFVQESVNPGATTPSGAKMRFPITGIYHVILKYAFSNLSSSTDAFNVGYSLYAFDNIVINQNNLDNYSGCAETNIEGTTSFHFMCSDTTQYIRFWGYHTSDLTGLNITGNVSVVRIAGLS